MHVKVSFRAQCSLKKKSIFTSVYIIGATYSNYLAAILLSTHLLQRLRNQTTLFYFMAYFISTQYENFSIIRDLERNLERLTRKISHKLEDVDVNRTNEKEKVTGRKVARSIRLFDRNPSIYQLDKCIYLEQVHLRANKSIVRRRELDSHGSLRILARIHR